MSKSHDIGVNFHSNERSADNEYSNAIYIDTMHVDLSPKSPIGKLYSATGREEGGEDQSLELLALRNRSNIPCGISNERAVITNEKLIYPAATRNKEPILQVLKRLIFCDGDNENDHTIFVEISSGSGQHLAHFAPHFPTVIFQPTEYDKTLLGSISYYANNCPTKNIKPPILLDIRNKMSSYGFEENSIDYIYNANMIHISPFECTIGLFENSGEYLKSDALLITYGPYSKDGVITPESNVQFNISLKSRNPSWGLRDITELEKLAEQNNLSLIDTVEMPANNHILIFKKN